MRRDRNDKDAQNNEALPYPDSDPQPRKDGKREKPLAIRGTLDDVLRAAMNVKPKDEQVKANRP